MGGLLAFDFSESDRRPIDVDLDLLGSMREFRFEGSEFESSNSSGLVQLRGERCCVSESSSKVQNSRDGTDGNVDQELGVGITRQVFASSTLE